MARNLFTALRSAITRKAIKELGHASGALLDKQGGHLALGGGLKKTKRYDEFFIR